MIRWQLYVVSTITYTQHSLQTQATLGPTRLWMRAFARGYRGLGIEWLLCMRLKNLNVLTHITNTTTTANS